MFEFLEKLRAKPAHHRKAIAFGVSAIFTLFVFVGWSSTLNLSLGGQDGQADSSGSGALASVDQNGNTVNVPTSQTANLESAVSPFNSITDSIGSAISDFKNHLDFSKKEVPVVDKAHNPVPGLMVNPEDIKATTTAVY